MVAKVESIRKEEHAIYNKIIPAGEGWMYELSPGQVLRIGRLGRKPSRRYVVL